MELLSFVDGSHNVAQDVEKLIECPICMEIPLPPIYLCNQSHIVCNECQKKIVTCPLCQGDFSKTRNFLAESIVEKCTMKCKFSEQGCQAIMTGAEILVHLKTCPYRPLKCHECHEEKWIKSGEYLDHLQEFHLYDGRSTNEGYARYKLGFSPEVLSEAYTHLWRLYPITSFNRTFFLRVRCVKYNICAHVFLHGERADCEKYEALIEFRSVSDERLFDLKWKGKISDSRDDPASDVMLHGGGLIIPAATIRFLAVARTPEAFPSWRYYFKIQEKVVAGPAGDGDVTNGLEPKEGNDNDEPLNKKRKADCKSSTRRN